MKRMRKLLWLVICVCLVLTWLPYFGFFNSPNLIGFIPEPLALTLICNVILTLCVLAMYPLYFIPFVNKLNEKPMPWGKDDE
ncbi:hypothetical protein [Psychromonas sp. 14N.309.X.WAT.B.A12]|jgi:bacteriorhodopsin|uniref:hypothetical protein n=1 Tax=unclassified Psychromonas TaxID=2614957 RepID=UPI0025B12EC8|nr:hypothetical protein [Psychromonas sp. 14N.309.X.WAT.B.A12]MDN2663612.1 hypothetical protein [Psychromonas sp. 14N.309.X.WAT.B.A12]